MLSKKGFTLVELLVTMAILGIITAMSFPVLKTLSENINEKKLKSYAKSIESSAKLYVDSYGNDLFPDKKSGVACIYFSQMKTKSLVKDITDNNISCNSSSTFVKVKKLGDVYKYDVQLGCGKKSNAVLKPEAVKMIYPKDSNLSCGVTDKLTYKLNIDPANHEGNDKKSMTVKVSLSSATGINNRNTKISYAWTKDLNSQDKAFKYLNFDILSPEKQKSILENTDEDISITKTIKTPGETGKWYLVIKVDEIRDIYNEKLNPDSEKNYGGVYVIDNTPPVINSVEVTSRKTLEQNKSNVKLNLSVTDKTADVYTKDKDLKICVKNDDSKCSSYDNYNSEYLYNETVNYNGKEQKIYITIKDLAGNKAKAIATYTYCPDNICYISKDGSDNGFGTRKYPFSTIQKGFDMVSDNGSVTLLSDIYIKNYQEERKPNQRVVLQSDNGMRYTIYRNDGFRKCMLYQSNKNDGSYLHIKNVNFDGRNVDSDTAILCLSGKVLVEDSTLKNARNLDNYGGAIHTDIKTTELTLNRVEIKDCYASQGGAAIWGRGKIVMNNIDIHHNTSKDGTVWYYASQRDIESLTMNSGRIHDNRAKYDPGIRNFGFFYMNGGEIDHNTATNNRNWNSGGLLDGWITMEGVKYFGESNVRNNSYLQSKIHDNSLVNYKFDHEHDVAINDK